MELRIPHFSYRVISVSPANNWPHHLCHQPKSRTGDSSSRVDSEARVPRVAYVSRLTMYPPSLQCRPSKEDSRSFVSPLPCLYYHPSRPLKRSQCQATIADFETMYKNVKHFRWQYLRVPAPIMPCLFFLRVYHGESGSFSGA